MINLKPAHGGQLRQIAEHFHIPVSEMLDFSANINPEGPPPAVLSRLRTSLDDPSVLASYPDLEEIELRQALRSYANVRLENLVVANGFVPLLEATLRVLATQRCRVLVPAFVEYRKTLERSQVKMVPHILAASDGFCCHADELLQDSYDAILLANPQNPSGVLLPREVLLKIIEGAAERDIYVLLDEAFIDYFPEASLLSEIHRVSNLIVFRSLTKFFGMAGLRVAYAVTNPELSRKIHEATAPWSITTLASLAAAIAVQDEEFRRHAITLNEARRSRLQLAIGKLGIHVYHSAASFLLLRLPGTIDGQNLWERLITRHRIVLRNCSNYEGLGDGYLRSAVRTEAENERLIEALTDEMRISQ